MTLKSKTSGEIAPLPVTKAEEPEEVQEQLEEHLQEHLDSEAAEAIEQFKHKERMRRLRRLQELAARVKINPDGVREFIRFSRVQIIEHYVLIGSFGTLVFTGLLQTFSRLAVIGWIIQVLGGVDTLRSIHHLAAIILIMQSVYHVVQILVMWIVKRERGGMWPSVRDFRNLFQTLMFNLGLAKTKPESDRYSTEEKLEYWAMLWGTPIMIITGLIIWFPVVVTKFFPGVIVPISLTIHRWEAILATLAILTWHMYHTNIREVNRSIFNGTMTEEEMQHEHPIEYRRILAAYELMQKDGKKEEDS